MTETGNKGREKATAEKQAISKEEQKHFRDVCYFPLLSPPLSHILPPPALPIIIIVTVFSSSNLWGDILGKMRQVYIKCKLLM